MLRREAAATRGARHSANRPGTLLVATILAASAIHASRHLPAPVAFVGDSWQAARSAPSALVNGDRGQREHSHVSAKFFDKIQEMLGMKNPEEQALADLKKLETAALQQAEAEVKALQEARLANRAAELALQKAVASLRSTRESVLEACELGWEEAEETWDASLTKCAEPVLEKAGDTQAAMAALQATSDTLAKKCKAAEAGSAKRTAAAEAVVAKLQPEQRGSLAEAVLSASQPLSEGSSLRLWALGRAEVTDAKRQLRELDQEVKEDPVQLANVLKDRRATRCKEELAKAEAAAAKAAEEAARQAAAAAAAAAKSASATSSVTGSDEEGGPPAGAIIAFASVIALLLAAAFAANQLTGGTVSSPRTTSTAAVAVQLVAPNSAES